MSTVIVAVFSLGIIGIFFGIILSILDIKLKVKDDPLIEKLKEVVLGIDCGACGFPSCRAFIKALIENKNSSYRCIVGGEEINRKISELLGLSQIKNVSKKRVVILCGANFLEKKSSIEYLDPKTCRSANITLGNIDCKYGCLGFADCVKVCPVSALEIRDGLVKVNYKKCIGCGKCVEICPRKIIKLVELKNDYLVNVSCNNPQEALDVKKVCIKGCIGCTLCVKLIKDSPFYMEKNISRLNFDKLENRSYLELKIALEKCPVKIIEKFDV